MSTEATGATGEWRWVGSIWRGGQRIQSFRPLESKDEARGQARWALTKDDEALLVCQLGTKLAYQLNGKLTN